MLNPTAEYKQHVLANKPTDITVDPVTGFYEHNGHSFPTYLRAKWYRDYIRKWRRQNNIIVANNATVTTFTREGVEYTQLYFGQTGSFTLNNTIRNVRYALGGGGSNGGRTDNPDYLGGGGGAGGLIHVPNGINLNAGLYQISVGAGGPANNVTGGGSNGSSSILTTPTETITAFGGGRGGSAGTGNSAGQPGASGGGGRATFIAPANQSVANPSGTGMPGQGFDGGYGYASEIVAERASGGGGGAGGPGVPGSLGVAGNGGPGVLLTWTDTDIRVCAGGPGMIATDSLNSPDRILGWGSRGSSGGTAGKGGDGFMFMVFPSDEGTVYVGNP